MTDSEKRAHDLAMLFTKEAFKAELNHRPSMFEVNNNHTNASTVLTSDYIAIYNQIIDTIKEEFDD